MTRAILLGMFLVIWGVIAVVAVTKTGDVPSTMWAALGVGLGTIAGLVPSDEKRSIERKARKRGEDDSTTEEAKS